MPNTKNRDLRFYKHEPEISEVVSDDELYDQQVCLYKGLDKNPDKNSYGGIIALSAEKKTSLQQKLREVITKEFTPRSSPKIYPYSLCLHLKGLTYYELFKNTIEFIYLNSELDPSLAQKHKDDYNFLIGILDAFSMPSKPVVEITPEAYKSLNELTYNLTMLYTYDVKKYEFLQPPGARYYAMERFKVEVNKAVDSVINQTRCFLNSQNPDNEIGEGSRVRMKFL